MEGNIYPLTVSCLLSLACFLQVTVPLLFAVAMRNPRLQIQANKVDKDESFAIF